MSNTITGLDPKKFQKEVDGKQTALYILRNSKGHEVGITNYGGALVAIMVPDRNGNLGIMDYYRMQNMQADTSMREAIARPEASATQKKK